MGILPRRRRQSTFARGAFTARSFRGAGALVAAAAVVTPADGQRLARNRRGWQAEAFAFRRAVPEVGYVMRFLGNNSNHIRLYVGDRDPNDPDSLVPIDENYQGDLPADLRAAAQQVLDYLTGSSPSGGGASILAPLVQNFETVGECWLVGQYDPEADREEWAVHSVSEVKFMDGRFPGMNPAAPPGYYRLTTGFGRDSEAVDLDPATTTVIRMWVADPEWSSEPDSPMRTLTGVCSQLLLCERAVQAALRTRVAMNGLLLMPEEIDLGGDDDDPADPDAEPGDGEDEWFRDFTTQMTTPLVQDGSAASVVPGMLTGPYQYLDRVRVLTMERPMDPQLADREQKLLMRLGVGLDVPPEVVTGYADVNHWNVWQITADTFKQHQEPVTITGCDALTMGYLWARLRSVGAWDETLIRRVVVGYDPANLISKPDQRQVANDAHDRKAITDAAYLRIVGLDPSDAPTNKADEFRLVGATGMTVGQLVDLGKVAADLLRWGYDPASVTAGLGLPFTHTGLIPMTFRSEEALEQAGVPPIPGDTSTPADSGGTTVPPVGGGAAAARVPSQRLTPTQAALARLLRGTPHERLALTAAARRPRQPTDEQRRLSRRLMELDRRLRERLTAAADAAVHRALERAGNRARAAAQRNDAARTAAAGQPPHRVAAALGRTMVAALGLDEQQLLSDAFARLREQYTTWTAAASEDAISLAARITGLDRTDPAVKQAVARLRDSFADAADAAWPRLEESLTSLAADYLYDPDRAWGELGELPDALVPPGLLREVLMLAGGALGDAVAGQSGPFTGLTSGSLLGGFFRDAGAEQQEMMWVYGISARPFEPHEALDGVTFTDWTDPALSTAGTAGEWVGGSYVPGDHDGCHCDYQITWAGGESSYDEQAAAAQDAWEAQNPGEEYPTRPVTNIGFRDDLATIPDSGGGAVSAGRTTE